MFINKFVNDCYQKRTTSSEIRQTKYFRNNKRIKNKKINKECNIFLEFILIN